MTRPPDPTSRPRKRSRLFQAAPDALFVEEWVPNITLPPPPDVPLEEEEGGVKLDEHGLPERREEEEEPEDERRGPARIYVGKGATAKAQGPVTNDELPISDVELPDYSLPTGADPDREDGSDPSMPDLSIDGSGSSWGSMFDDLADDEEPTDPELRSADTDDGPGGPPLAMPSASVTEPQAPPVTPAPRLDRSLPAAPLTTTPARGASTASRDAAQTAKPTPSWARSSKAPVAPGDTPTPSAKPQPPRIRATQPKPPEPGLVALVPRSLIITVVVLVVLALLVLAFRRPSSDPVGQQTPPAGPAATPELTLHPGAMDLDTPPSPAPEPAPAPEASPSPESTPAPAAAPVPVEPAPVRQAQPAPAPAQPRSVTQPTSERQPVRAAPAPAPEPTPPAPAASAPVVAEPAGNGFLVVESDRYAMIYMGGRRLGGTPIARMELEPGSYAVRAVCRDTGATKTQQVEIAPGQLATASFRFMP